MAMTADDLLRLPEDGFRYELVKGELVQMAPAGHEHGELAMRLGWRLAQHVEANDLGKVYAAETGFRLASAPDTVRAADSAFVCKRRLREVGRVKGYWPGAPDLAVEVASDSDTFAQVEGKVSEWLEAGTRMVLVVNPRGQTVTVYRSLGDISILDRGDTLDASEVVPGWTCPVEGIFG